jgi:hypothetical protein
VNASPFGCVAIGFFWIHGFAAVESTAGLMPHEKVLPFELGFLILLSCSTVSFLQNPFAVGIVATKGST